MKNVKYPFQLPELPYAYNALEPFISENTMSFHHTKHHQTYITNLNSLLTEHALKDSTLEQIIMQTFDAPEEKAIFNNAAQVWNHTFFWSCMRKDGGGVPKNTLLKQLERDFDNYNNFKAQFIKEALSQFGSGWTWLVWDKNQARLLITKTSNADLPMVRSHVALFTLDVWEHAYYLDYQNRRAEYANVFFDHLINWDFIEAIFAGR